MARRPADEDDDILDFQPEVYDDPPPPADDLRDEGGGQAPLLLSIALGLAMIVAILVTGWYFLADSQGDGEGGVPIVQADPAPIKARPADPGGMEVPNQDKLVYERLGQSESISAGERLLPGPETPQPPPTLATPKPETSGTAPPAATPAAQPPVTTAALPPEPAKAEPAKVEPAKVEPAKTEPAKTEPAKPAETKPAEQVAAVPAIKPGKGGWLVQLAAMRDAEAADRQWAQLVGANKDLLGSLSPDVVRADLGAKGVFYRLRAGTLDETSARRLCDELAKRKIGCLVVRK